MIRAWLLALVLCAVASTSAAQIRLSAGEHAGFTRIVLQTPAGLGWTLEGEGRERRFIPQAAQDFDLSGLFRRIARTRLAEARIDGGGLNLVLACYCDVRAWQERPGLVVLDITDPAVPAQGAPPQIAPVTVEPAPPPRVRSDPAALARRAGERLAGDARSALHPPPAADAASLDQIAGQLGVSMAMALSQGLLDAASPHAQTGVTLPSAPPAMAEAHPNMRLQDVTSRDDPATREAQAPDPACTDSASLDFLGQPASGDFMATRGTLVQSLYGEFDQPSDPAHADLARLYLSAGFGAEARAVLGTLSGPLPGRDLLLGFADVLEGRMSNSRLRLAAMAGCGNAATLAAILAGAPAEAISANAAAAALAFGRAPAALRAVVGADLTERLVNAGALDAARIVGEDMHRSAWATPADRAIVDAVLPAPLTPGRLTQADDAPLRSADAMASWLDRAVRDGTAVSAETLNEAIALSEQQGPTEVAQSILQDVARLWLRSETPQEALVALDRITGSIPEGHHAPQELIDEIWQGVARSVDDRTFLALMLMREDWRSTALSADTRNLIARRLNEQGLAEAAARLDPGALTTAADQPEDPAQPQAAVDATGPSAGAPDPAPPGSQTTAPQPPPQPGDGPDAAPAAAPLPEPVLGLPGTGAPVDPQTPPPDQSEAGPVTRAAALLGSSEHLRALVAETLDGP